MGIGIEAYAKEDARSVEQRLSEKLRERAHLLNEIKAANRMIGAPVTVEDNPKMRKPDATYLHPKIIARDIFGGEDVINTELRLHIAQHLTAVMEFVTLRVEAHLPRLNDEIKKLIDELQEALNLEPVTEPGTISTAQAEDIVEQHRRTMPGAHVGGE